MRTDWRVGVAQVNGDHHYDARKGLLLWTIDLIDKTNSSGAMEFVASPAAPSDSFFPVEVRCDASNTTCFDARDVSCRVLQGMFCNGFVALPAELPAEAQPPSICRGAQSSIPKIPQKYYIQYYKNTCYQTCRMPCSADPTNAVSPL